MAYSNQAQLGALSADRPRAQAWGGRAIELAERLGELEALVHALNNVGTAELRFDVPGGREKIERSLALALERRHGGARRTRVLQPRVDAGPALRARRGGGACSPMASPTACRATSTRGGSTWSAWRSVAELQRGRLRRRGRHPRLRSSAIRARRRSHASRRSSTLALVRARRGDPGHAELLDDALETALPTGELQRLGPVAAARAEVAWLAARRRRVTRGDGAGVGPRVPARRSVADRRAGAVAPARRCDRAGAGRGGGAVRARARRPPGRRRRLLDRAAVPVRGGARDSRHRGARPPRRPRGRRPATPPRPARGDAGQPGRADGARGRGAGAGRARASATPRSRSGWSSPAAPSTTTCPRSCASSMCLRAGVPARRPSV